MTFKFWFGLYKMLDLPDCVWQLDFDLCSNNSIEVNLLECEQKEKVDFEVLSGETSETDSNAGKIAAQLQDKTYKIF